MTKTRRFIYFFSKTGPIGGAGRRSDCHTVRAGVKHVLLRGLRAGRTRAVHAKRGLLLPVRLRVRRAGAQAGAQVAQDGSGRGAHRVRSAHRHQEQRLAGRRVTVPVGRARQPAQRSVRSALKLTLVRQMLLSGYG